MPVRGFGRGAGRVYLDWNATAPLRPEARAAMLDAMDRLGNPSSVHAEGREARAIVERARSSVARLVGCEPPEIVFTSGATEANNMAMETTGTVYYAPTEHSSVIDAATNLSAVDTALSCTRSGRLDRSQSGLAGDPPADGDYGPPGSNMLAVAAANSETGVIEDVREVFEQGDGRCLRGHCDMTQAVGRIPFSFLACGAKSAALSAHKLGGPQGCGAYVHDGSVLPDRAFSPVLMYGGGQEQGFRPGTQNVIGIAGFGAAADAAQRDVEDGRWAGAEVLRDELEARLADAAQDLIVIGTGAPRLPNTSCFAVPGWRGETQVMQMDLAGFAVSAGSACSSGKVRASHVLRAMGYDDATAGSAIRVSIGPTTTEAEVSAFADSWIAHYRKRAARAV